MPKVIVTAAVEDGAKWEEGFRTHGDHFRTMTVTAPIGIAVNGNEIALCFEPANADTFIRSIDTPDNVAAMAHDGVKRETVKVYVMDKEFQP